jgi:hypothetical protein
MSSEKGMNGKQIAEKNLQTFLSWSTSKSHDDFRSMTSRGVLSRKEIAIECGFAKSALDQNPRIKSALQELERGLRERGVLPPLVPVAESDSLPVREAGGQRQAQDAERLRRLEQENAALKAEVAELRRVLGKHTILREALALTGRLPR